MLPTYFWAKTITKILRTTKITQNTQKIADSNHQRTQSRIQTKIRKRSNHFSKNFKKCLQSLLTNFTFTQGELIITSLLLVHFLPFASSFLSFIRDFILKRHWLKISSLVWLIHSETYNLSKRSFLLLMTRRSRKWLEHWIASRSLLHMWLVSKRFTKKLQKIHR